MIFGFLFRTEIDLIPVTSATLTNMKKNILKVRPAFKLQKFKNKERSKKLSRRRPKRNNSEHFQTSKARANAVILKLIKHLNIAENFFQLEMIILETLETFIIFSIIVGFKNS